MIISMIVAMGPNNEIGLNNKLLWHIPEDLKNFKAITLNKVIVMGRKTFESIGKPLPKRHTIILTRDQNYKIEGCDVISDPLMVFDLGLNYDDSENSELIICGGEEIYKIYLPYANRIYLSKVNYAGTADAYFPRLNMDEWEIVEEKKYENYDFFILERK